MRKYWFNSISGNISDLQTWHHQSKSKGEQNDTCHAVAMTTVLLLVLFKYKLKFPFFFTQKSSTPKNLLRNLFDNVGSMSVSIGTFSLTFWGCNLRYLFLRRKGTGAKYVAMTTKLQDSFCSLFDLNLLCQV